MANVSKLHDENIFKHLVKSKKVFATVVLAAVGLYSLILLSFILVNKQWQIKLHSNTALSEYATVIAGTVGTAVTILGVAFLIYAYQAQQRQAQTALFNKLYEDLLNDINSIQYRKQYGTGSAASYELFQGVEALFQYEARDDKVASSVLNHLNLILVSFRQLVDLLSDEHASIDGKDILLQKIYLLYLAKIYWPCHKISHVYRHYIIDKEWGYPRMLFYYLDFMTSESHRYLRANGFLKEQSAITSSNQLLSKAPGQKELSTQERELQSIMSCDYKDINTYWRNPPIISGSKVPVLQESTLNKAIVRLLGETPFSDAVLEKVNQGAILEFRDFLFWLKTAFAKRKPSSSQDVT